MIQPINNTVLVEIVEDAPDTGVFARADDKRKDGLLKGRVIAIDQALSKHRSPGDIILFASYGYDEVIDGDRTLLLVPYDLVKGIWTE